MDLTHIHLLLNHIPTIGFVMGLGLYLWALLARSADLQRAALLIFVGIGLLAIPTYVSGNAAQESLAKESVSKTLIETHEGAALEAFAVIEFTGAVAWLGLWQFRRLSRPSKLTLNVVLALSLVSLALVARAANIGGEIRHAEIRATPETTTAEGPLGRTIGLAVTSSPWGWPALETLHFIGLTLLLGVVLLIDMRMLGVIKGVTFRSLHRLIPWAVLGFCLNVLTGMMFFVASPDQYAHNPAFVWKLALILLAGANALYFTLFDEAWELQAGDEAPGTAKFAAVSALVLWVGVLYFGSMLPFIGNAF